MSGRSGSLRKTLFAVVAMVVLFAASCGSDELTVSEPPAAPTSTTQPPSTPSTSAETEEPTSTAATPEVTAGPTAADVGGWSLVRCLDLTCSEAHRVTLEPPVLSGDRDVGADATVLTREDGRPLVVSISRWFSPVAPLSELTIYSCADEACSSVTRRVAVEGANYASAALAPDGSLVIAYQSGQQLLCGPEGCADPESIELSALELLVCPDPDNCSQDTGRTVVLDREGATGQRPSLHIDQAGVPVVVYQRELGDFVGEVLVARCTDPSCADNTVAVAWEAELGGLAYVSSRAGLQTDGSAAFLKQAEYPDESVVWIAACADLTCSEAVEASDHLPPLAGFVINEQGDFVRTESEGFMTEDQRPSHYELTVVTCPDGDCSDELRSPAHHLAPQVENQLGLDPGPLQLMPNGAPTWLFATGQTEESFSTWLLVCDDPACTTAQQRHFADIVTEQWRQPEVQRLAAFTVYLELE